MACDVYVCMWYVFDTNNYGCFNIIETHCQCCQFINNSLMPRYRMDVKGNFIPKYHRYQTTIKSLRCDV